MLTRLNDVCEGDGFKILEEGELLSLFPAGSAADATVLSKAITYLKDHEYIDVEYAEDGVYCLRPLQKGREYKEEVRTEKSDSFRRRRDTVLLTAAGAFLGAFLGAITVWLLITYVF